VFLNCRRWLFIIEAVVTVFVAICAMYVNPFKQSQYLLTYLIRFILPDYPNTTKSFTPEERAIAVRRMRHPDGHLDEERGSVFAGLRMAVSDYKTWLLAYVTYFSNIYVSRLRSSQFDHHHKDQRRSDYVLHSHNSGNLRLQQNRDIAPCFTSICLCHDRRAYYLFHE
jgi:hypothetical protein